MRMWNVDSSKMCRRHLLGEHVEMHMFKGSIEKGHRIDGYIINNFVVLGNIKKRHDELAKEMKQRGYKHGSPMKEFDEGKGGIISFKVNEAILMERCNECKFLKIKKVVK